MDKQSKEELKEVPYQSPEATLSALEEVSLNVISPSAIAKAQSLCPKVKNHRMGNLPKNVKMKEVSISNTSLYCEVSQPNNPRPLVPKELRDLIVNLTISIGMVTITTY